MYTLEDYKLFWGVYCGRVILEYALEICKQNKLNFLLYCTHTNFRVDAKVKSLQNDPPSCFGIRGIVCKVILSYLHYH